MKYIVLYNPLSCNGRGKQKAEELKKLLAGEVVYFRDLTDVENLNLFFDGLQKEDRVILCGGDGTINCFVNTMLDKAQNYQIYYFATGSGNDFLNDVAPNENKLIPLNQYLNHLPVVEVNGRVSKFINGIGFGLDGYCCEEGDRQRSISSKKTNYTLIALKGLLVDYKPVNAEVIVDGISYKFERVWLAPSMFGKFYGGGMMIAPNQDRTAPDQRLTLVVVHDCGKMRLLTAFPTIKNGSHLKYKRLVEVYKGSDIRVVFDTPTALQIDGETVTSVCEYHAYFENEENAYER